MSDQSKSNLGYWLAAFGICIAWALATKFNVLGLAADWQSVSWGMLAVFVFYAVSVAVTHKFNPLHMAVGEDGRLSTSKFQFFLWTAVVVYAYVLIYALRAYHMNFGSVDSLPKNVLIAMGMVTITMASAKGITVAYMKSGQITKMAGPSNLADLVTSDDSATPDLVKIQMLIWTGIAVVLYLVRLAYDADAFAKDPTKAFPDIDQVLMILMGLGQGGYLGNKLVSTKGQGT